MELVVIAQWQKFGRSSQGSWVRLHMTTSFFFTLTLDHAANYLHGIYNYNLYYIVHLYSKMVIESFSYAVFHAFIKYLYTDEVDLKPEDAVGRFMLHECLST